VATDDGSRPPREVPRTLGAALRTQGDALAARLCAGLAVVVVEHAAGPALLDAASNVRRATLDELAHEPPEADAFVCLDDLGRETGALAADRLADLGSAGRKLLVALPPATRPPHGGSTARSDALATLGALDGAVVIGQHTMEIAWIGDDAQTVAVNVPERAIENGVRAFVAVGFPAAEVLEASGTAHPAATPVHAEHLRALERANAALRHANAALARGRLGPQDAGAASRLSRLETDRARTHERAAALEQQVAAWEQAARQNDSYFQAARRQLQTRRHRYVEAVHYRARALPVVGAALRADAVSPRPPAEDPAPTPQAAAPVPDAPAPSEDRARFVLFAHTGSPGLAAATIAAFRSMFGPDDAVELAVVAPAQTTSALAVREELLAAGADDGDGAAVVLLSEAEVESDKAEGTLRAGDATIGTGVETAQIFARMLAFRDEMMGEAVSNSIGVHGTYVGDDRVFVTTTWGGRLLAPARDLGLTPELLAAGEHDVALTRLAQAELIPGDTVIDVGARVGTLALLAARLVGPTGHVIAYEPDEDERALLRTNIDLNGAGDLVEVPDPIALTDLSLDGEAAELERIDLLRVDGGGAEHRVLLGAEDLLRGGVIRRAYVIADPSAMCDGWVPFVDFIRRLAGSGWQLSRLDDEGRRLTMTPGQLDELSSASEPARVLLERPSA
jgi:hypothetical protein